VAIEAYRQWLADAHQKACGDYDKAILTLAAGALGVSIAFVDNIAPNPDHKWVLAIAWILFTCAMVVVLVSFATSQRTILRMIRGIDDGNAVDAGWLGKATGILNIASGSAFVSGTGFLIAFVLENL
jgi:hypothetical protein